MKLMSVDQSLSHCAVLLWDENDKPFYREVIKTGSSSSKKKDAEVVYFNTPEEQIIYISNRIKQLCLENSVTDFAMESLSYGSFGSATRDLAGLYYCILQGLLTGENALPAKSIYKIAPLKAKSLARLSLPEEERTQINKRVDKKTGKTVQSVGQRTMGKDEVILACNYAYPGWLDGVTKTRGGKSDLADAFFIGKSAIASIEEATR